MIVSKGNEVNMETFDNNSVVVTSRCDAEEAAILEKAVQLSGRSRSDVVRRLIKLIDTPQGRAVLGIVEPPEAVTPYPINGR
jgi:hypothetical protein